MIQAYGVWKEKSLYGRKYMGIERTTVVINEDGTIRKIFPKVKVNGHFTEVLQALG
jgi:peroxiredoxin Q/BCP